MVRLAPQECRTYFVTAVTANRRRVFQVENAADLMVQVLTSYRDHGQFALHAFVIMPDHVHLLITPARNVSLEKAVQFVKGGFSFRLKSKRDVWERGFNSAQIVSFEKYAACRKYVEENPVRARLAAAAREYAYSSGRLIDCVDPMPEHFVRG